MFCTDNYIVMLFYFQTLQMVFLKKDQKMETNKDKSAIKTDEQCQVVLEHCHGEADSPKGKIHGIVKVHQEGWR